VIGVPNGLALTGLATPRRCGSSGYNAKENLLMDFFSDSSSLYFYGALVQANAAILSIIGIFVVFRIQSVRSSVDAVRSVLSADPGKFTAPAEIGRFDRMTLEEKHQWLTNKKARANPSPVLSHFEAWARYLDQIRAIKSSARVPVMLFGITICLFTIGIFLANYIHSVSFAVEFVSMASSVVLEVICVVVVLRIIGRLIGYYEKPKI
jgi:hypothetical protein